MPDASNTRLAIILIGGLCGFTPLAIAEELIGFPDSSEQQALETEFRTSLSADDQAVWAKDLSARPHHPGSEHGRVNIDYMAQRFESWGFDVEVEWFDILLPVPAQRSLTLLEPEAYTAGLLEDVVAGDASTAQRDEVLPPYNAFSVDGDVTAELVFVNYGIPEDYELLERYGIDVTGKIVIAKYGRSWRGIKPKLAAERERSGR